MHANTHAYTHTQRRQIRGEGRMKEKGGEGKSGDRRGGERRGEVRRARCGSVQL